MPCMDGGPSPGESARDKIDRLTRMLCEVNAIIDRFLATGSVRNRSEEALKWWAEHKKADRKRAKEEMGRAALEAARRTALAKLTDLEREALGFPKS